jgi:hypothetical protein
MLKLGGIKIIKRFEKKGKITLYDLHFYIKDLTKKIKKQQSPSGPYLPKHGDELNNRSSDAVTETSGGPKGYARYAEAYPRDVRCCCTVALIAF